MHISITHSFNFSAIIISDIEGIDIEMQRKILRIAHKFTQLKYTEPSPMKMQWCETYDCLVQKSHFIKALLKRSEFLENIYVEDFRLDETKPRLR